MVPFCCLIYPFTRHWLRDAPQNKRGSSKGLVTFWRVWTQVEPLRYGRPLNTDSILLRRASFFILRERHVPLLGPSAILIYWHKKGCTYAKIAPCKGFRNTAQGIWNPTNDWNPTLKSGIQVPLTKTGNRYTTAWNPRQPYMGQQRVPKRSGLGHHNVLSEIAVLMFGTPTS